MKRVRHLVVQPFLCPFVTTLVDYGCKVNQHLLFKQEINNICCLYCGIYKLSKLYFMVERILKLIETKTYGNEADFALKIGVKQQTLNNYTNGKRPVKLDTVLAILHTYSDVSAEWLLRGKGEMFLSDNLPPILGDESENDLDTHAMLAQARKEIDTLHIELESLKEKNLKQAGCIEWQKDFISELIAEKTELEKKIPNESKKDIV